MKILSILLTIVSVAFASNVRLLEDDGFVASNFVGTYTIDDTCRQDLCCCFFGDLLLTQENDGSLRITISGNGIEGALCPADDSDLPRNGDGDVFIPINPDAANPDVFQVSLIGQVFTFAINDDGFQIQAPNSVCSSEVVRKPAPTLAPTAPPELIDIDLTAVGVDDGSIFVAWTCVENAGVYRYRYGEVGQALEDFLFGISPTYFGISTATLKPATEYQIILTALADFGDGFTIFAIGDTTVTTAAAPVDSAEVAASVAATSYGPGTIALASIVGMFIGLFIGTGLLELYKRRNKKPRLESAEMSENLLTSS